MKTKFIDIKTEFGTCDTFIAYPNEGGVYPAVLFLMDAIGPREYLYEMAKTIAARGFYVFLPNLFYEVRRAPLSDVKFPIKSADDLPALWKQIMPLLQTYKVEKTMKDIQVFLDFLSEQFEVKPGPMAVTGYCLGGGLAIRTAALCPERVVAAASFHSGNLATETPESPHRLLGQLKAELYIAHADNDAHMPMEQMDRLRAALGKSGVQYEEELYVGAAHGFTMMDLPAYNENALKRHWEKLFALLERSFKI